MRSEGVVEICLDGVWGTIADNDFFRPMPFAEVVCRQLGFPRERKCIGSNSLRHKVSG